MKTLNLVGRQMSKLRYERNWTQDELADKLQLVGWPITPSGVSKIEGGSVYVPDFRLFYLACGFRVQLPVLFPKINLSQPIHETMLRFIRNENRGLIPERTGGGLFNPALLLAGEKDF